MANPYIVKQSESVNTEITPSDVFSLLRQISTDYTPLLSPTESAVLHFIFMRTIWWKKSCERISLNQFTNGIYSEKDGGLVIGPIKVTERTVRRAIKQLDDHGMIVRTYAQCINGQDDIPMFEINVDWGQKMLKQPKNPFKKGKKTMEGGVANLSGGAGKIYRRGVANLSTLNNNNINTNNIKDECKAEPAQDIEAAIAAARVRANSARMKKVERARNNPQSVASLFTVWEHAVRTHFPDYPVVQPWTRKQLGQMADFRAAFAKSNPGMKVSAFIEFCVQHWRRIGVLHFSNLKNGNFPTYPDVGFMMGMKRGFLTSFADNDFAERTAKLTEADRKVAKLIRQGYTREEAERAVQQDTGSRRALEQQLAESERARLDNIALKRKLEEAKRDNRDLRQQASVGAKQRVLSRFEKSVVKVRVRTDDAELEALPGWSEE